MVYVPRILEGCGFGRLPRGVKWWKRLGNCFRRAGGQTRLRCRVFGCEGSSKAVELAFTVPGGEN